MAISKMEDPPLRPTGNMERFNIVRSYVKFYNKVQVAATYTAPRSILGKTSDSKTGFRNLIYSALAETLNTQPILGVTIEDEGSQEPRWVRLETIDLCEIVKFIEEDPNSNPDSWIQAGHREPLDRLEELPVWRVIVAVQGSARTATTDEEREGDTFSFTLAFFCHHAIGDGLSAGAFHLTLLDALNHLLDNPSTLVVTSESTTIPVPKLPLIPTLEMGTPLPISLFYALKKIFQTYIYSPVDPQEWSGPLIDPSGPRPPICNLRSFTLDPAIVSKLVSRCREEKTSLTALITVLVARKLALMYPTHSRFRGTIPFSMRKFTGHTQQDMGVFVSNAQPYFSSEATPPTGYISCRSPPSSSKENPTGPKDDKELWHSARACKSFLNTTTSTPTNQNVGLLGYAHDLPNYFLGLLGTKRAHAFEVTNIGVLDGGVVDTPNNDFHKKERVTFNKVAFSGSVCTYGDPYCVSVASARGGELSVSVCWDGGVLGEEEVGVFVAGLEGWLRGLV
ncbi:MAG: hypothetical protein M1834_001626 [Cirrosporium novae-zelandiae]|nr:MAG: hypothetical protein M1834_004143 [Cirrosporium novae-zelandiae]KAI9735610.1 MAG: hypothetical protein M1834_001626 [Cirrosporium novae-zelandiae]